MKKLFINFGMPGVAAILLVFALISALNPPRAQKKEPYIAPNESPFSKRIAGVGIVEPKTKVVNVDTNTSGVLTELYVSENQKIKKGDPLFKLDDRHTKAEVKLAETNLTISELNYKDLSTSLERFERVEAKLAISEEELSNKRFEVEKAKVDISRNMALLDLAKTNLELLTTRAPMDGMVLKINSNLGEFVNNATQEPPMILGDLENLHVRVSIDESDFTRFSLGAKAVGFLRGGGANSKIEMSFVRLEQIATPKKNLSNDSSEKIDTRIVEIIYKFHSDKVRVVPGQQLDVFIAVNPK